MHFSAKCIRTVVICLAVTLIPLTAAMSADKPIELKFANYFPPQSSQSKLCEEFIADVAQRTGGLVTMKYFPGGSLAKAPAIIKSVEMGIADIGFSHISYTAGRFPVTEACELPHGFPTGRSEEHTS